VRARPREVELDNRSSFGEQLAVDPLVHLPDEQRGVELLEARLAECALHTPRPECLDHRLEIPARLRQVVLGDL
jgi:hypothetical protein